MLFSQSRINLALAFAAIVALLPTDARADMKTLMALGQAGKAKDMAVANNTSAQLYLASATRRQAEVLRALLDRYKSSSTQAGAMKNVTPQEEFTALNSAILLMSLALRKSDKEYNDSPLSNALQISYDRLKDLREELTYLRDEMAKANPQLTLDWNASLEQYEKRFPRNGYFSAVAGASGTEQDEAWKALMEYKRETIERYKPRKDEHRQIRKTGTVVGGNEALKRRTDRPGFVPLEVDEDLKDLIRLERLITQLLRFEEVHGRMFKDLTAAALPDYVAQSDRYIMLVPKEERDALALAVAAFFSMTEPYAKENKNRLSAEEYEKSGTKAALGGLPYEAVSERRAYAKKIRDVLGAERGITRATEQAMLEDEGIDFLIDLLEERENDVKHVPDTKDSGYQWLKAALAQKRKGLVKGQPTPPRRIPTPEPTPAPTLSLPREASPASSEVKENAEGFFATIIKKVTEAVASLLPASTADNGGKEEASESNRHE